MSIDQVTAIQHSFWSIGWNGVSGHATAVPPSSVMKSRRFTAQYLPCFGPRKDSTPSSAGALADFSTSGDDEGTKHTFVISVTAEEQTGR